MESFIDVIANFATNAIPGQPINTIGLLRSSVFNSNLRIMLKFIKITTNYLKSRN
ncbi:hypothetical protein ES703_44822 [subsurface metagenome]